MKLGTESRNKTIAACVLGGVAVLLALNWMLNSGSSPQAAAPARPAQMVSPAATDDNAATDKKQSKKREEKFLTAVWKPSLDPSLNLRMLQDSERIEYKGSGRNIFDVTTQPVAEVKIPPPGAPGRTDLANAPQVPARPQLPVPPPINLKFYGFSTKNGQKTVFLVQNPASPDSVFVAHEGDIIARRYKIVRINQSSVEIQDLLSNNKQTINLSPS